MNPIVTVVGARPQFVKAAVVSRALAARGIDERLVHTGQHYDAAMSDVFFDELGMAPPAANLGVGSGLHGAQTARTMERFEAYLVDALAQGPLAGVVVYGDTNATLAAALVAAKLGLPLAHVEAGLRSFVRAMPEEINRVVTDRLSDLLFCPTDTAVAHLAAEGITPASTAGGVALTGDVMLEATRTFADEAAARAPLGRLTVHAPGAYVLATVHRAANTDDPAHLAAILDGLGRLGRPVLLPIHPRTRARLGGLEIASTVEVRAPASYLEMLTLTRNAHRVVTDSGGLQKEAFWLGVPCVTLREETEWTETLDGGWNHLAGADPARIATAAALVPTTPAFAEPTPEVGARIARLLAERWG